jgi:RNA-directed DNA polymerase
MSDYSLLDRLNDASTWQEYLESKLFLAHLPEWYIRRLERYVADRRYEKLAAEVSAGAHIFPHPRKRVISKAHTAKKRVVYTFPQEETQILKMVSYLMLDYDRLFAPNLYSFRRGIGAKAAIRRLSGIRGLKDKYVYKADVSNYFNSIDVKRLLPRLKEDLRGDARLYVLFESILSDPCAEWNGTTVHETKGVMAGIPISAFLADYYLKDLDWHFFREHVCYMRYADDMLVIADSEDELKRRISFIRSFLAENGLAMNPDKEIIYRPGQAIEFLGFSVLGREVDVGTNSMSKIKAKIRRSARSIRRWMLRKHAPEDPTLSVMIRKFERKFLGKGEDELSWKYWYFPTITTDARLREVDAYMQQNLRYIVVGRYNKKSFDTVPYERLKACGYVPLVRAWHEYIDGDDVDNETPEIENAEIQADL